MKGKLKVCDIEAIRPGTSMTFQVADEYAVGSAQALCTYLRRTRGYRLITSTDHPTLHITITRLPDVAKV